MLYNKLWNLADLDKIKLEQANQANELAHQHSNIDLEVYTGQVLLGY